MAMLVYADTDAGRLGAQLQDGIVHVWQAGHGSQLGGYKIERFEGGKLTASTLRKLFELPEPETFDEAEDNCTAGPVDYVELHRLIAEDERNWR